MSFISKLKKNYFDIFCPNAFLANFEKGLLGNEILNILI
jgi:hypothetical protein